MLLKAMRFTITATTLFCEPRARKPENADICSAEKQMEYRE
jgi:hypothetical protein